MNKQLLFVHIPKTAGTSFRLAGKRYFGEENTFFDYGEKSNDTSKLVKEVIYEENDFYKLSTEFEQHESMFLSGHFQANKYAPLFETLNTITFVREPVEQVLSHYKHFKSHNGYKEDLKTFVQEERFKNVQSRMLQSRPLELYGFIGLSEEYKKSIELINDYYDVDIKVLEANKHPDVSFTTDSLDQEMIALINKENSKDIEMYEKVKKIFIERVQCFENCEPYTHLLIQEKTDKRIRGCAFIKGSNEPVDVEIYADDKILATVKAKSFRPGLLVHGVPRKGFIGFELYWTDDTVDVNQMNFKINSKQRKYK